MAEQRYYTFTATGSATSINEDNGWYARVTTQMGNEAPRYLMTDIRFETEAEAQAFADAWAVEEVARFKRSAGALIRLLGHHD